MPPTPNDFGLLSPTYKQTGASVLVKTGVGKLRGIFVSSSSQATIKLWDNTSAATTVLVEEFTASGPFYYPMADVLFLTGLYITITGDLECTIFYF